MAAGACLPWFAARLTGAAGSWGVLWAGASIVGAAFLLCWAAEAAEMDVPQAVAIGLVALLAVLPEYAVDMVFAWKGGRDPSFIPFATANMTGANRLLIGVGWPAVLAAAWWKHGHRAIRLGAENAVELVTLFAATLYAFIIPFRARLSLVDTACFGALFLFYAWRSVSGETREPELEGPALTLAALAPPARRVALAALFVYAGVAIGLSAEPFAMGLLALGRRWGIEEFLLVQWIAPLASEAPEFIVAIVFALKGKAGVAFRALLSSKVNQWTLLVGMLPAVFNVSAGRLAPMPLDSRQVEEIALTAAQSLFGLALLTNLEFSLGEAAALLGLFSAQLLFFHSATARWAFAAAYAAAAVAVLAGSPGRRGRIAELVRRAFSKNL
ncbi:MAG: sodium:calcium antiporter [Elusimicrobia bacterium]|nr:sodium:calcium antiporter [Elusimicrobiota bacterium]